jgi:hypothetical protein
LSECLRNLHHSLGWLVRNSGALEAEEFGRGTLCFHNFIRKQGEGIAWCHIENEHRHIAMEHSEPHRATSPAMGEVTRLLFCRLALLDTQKNLD